MGTAAGIAVFKDGKFTIPKGSSRDAVIAFGVDREGRPLYSTEHGLFRVVGSAVEEITLGGVPLRSVDAIYRDPEGLVWLGTNGNGLRVLDERTARPRRLNFSDARRHVRFRNLRYRAGRPGQFLDVVQQVNLFGGAERSAALCGGWAQENFQHPVQSHGRVTCDRMQTGRSAWARANGQRADMVLHHSRSDRAGSGAPSAQGSSAAGSDRKSHCEWADRATGTWNRYGWRWARRVSSSTIRALSYLAPTRITFLHILDNYDKNWIDAGHAARGFLYQPPSGQTSFPRHGL